MGTRPAHPAAAIAKASKRAIPIANLILLMISPPASLDVRSSI
jgi:hypothetical protein